MAGHFAQVDYRSNLMNLVMEWIERLPEVGDPILKRLSAIRGLVDQAKEVERQATELKAKAYTDALKLEGDVANLWEAAEITKAKQTGLSPS
jgi:hypothetical protein